MTCIEAPFPPLPAFSGAYVLSDDINGAPSWRKPDSAWICFLWNAQGMKQVRLGLPSQTKNHCVHATNSTL
jgi:hypothetical protein